jgi:orotidine-5'-phosphate decarboxylase
MSSTTIPFADRLEERVALAGNPICLGLDPRFESLPQFLQDESIAQFGDTPRARAEAYLTFNRLLIDALEDIVPACKLQMAFYEELGADGMHAFAETVKLARERGILVISDAKRGDIGSTAEAYAHAHLGGPGSVFDADALTVNPFMGRDTLEPFLKACQENNRGIFVLVKTSNPGSGDLQDQRLQSGLTATEHIANMVHEIGAKCKGAWGLSSVGAVVGATYPDQARALRERMPDTIFLIPGYGAQGATAKDAVAGFRPDGRGAIVNNSRALIFAFKTPKYAHFGERDFASAARAAATDMARELHEERSKKS